MERLTPAEHHTRVKRGGAPHLRAQVDYIRFAPPSPLPAARQERGLSDRQAVRDADVPAGLTALE